MSSPASTRSSTWRVSRSPKDAGRWRRRSIRASRIDSTRALVRSIEGLDASARPRVFVCASAVGTYGSRGDEVLDEDAAPAEGFLADVCKEWASSGESVGEPRGLG
jgi:hypothetical protein